MYGATPPLLVALAPELLCDPVSVRETAAAYQDLLRRRPAWLVVPRSPLLVGRGRRDAMRALADDPAWDPAPADALDATIAVLRHVLAALGTHVPDPHPDDARVPPPPAGIVGAAGDAVAAAHALGGEVRHWGPDGDEDPRPQLEAEWV